MLWGHCSLPKNQNISTPLWKSFRSITPSSDRIVIANRRVSRALSLPRPPLTNSPILFSWCDCISGSITRTRSRTWESLNLCGIEHIQSSFAIHHQGTQTERVWDASMGLKAGSNLGPRLHIWTRPKEVSEQLERLLPPHEGTEIQCITEPHLRYSGGRARIWFPHSIIGLPLRNTAYEHIPV